MFSQISTKTIQRITTIMSVTLNIRKFRQFTILNFQQSLNGNLQLNEVEALFRPCQYNTYYNCNTRVVTYDTLEREDRERIERG